MKLKDLFSVVTGNELIDLSIEDERRYRFDLLDVRVRADGHHEQILPGMRREEARSVGLRVRADGHHEQILPGMRREEAGGLSNETEQARMDNLGDSSGGGTCADGADSVQPDSIVVDCGYLHSADVPAGGGGESLCPCWERILNPELLDYEVTEIHTSLRNDNPMLVVWIKAQNSDN